MYRGWKELEVMMDILEISQKHTHTHTHTHLSNTAAGSFHCLGPPAQTSKTERVSMSVCMCARERVYNVMNVC